MLLVNKLSERTIRILLVDDQSLVRAGLKELIEQAEDLAVVAESVDGDTTLEQIRRTAVDILVMDLEAPLPDATQLIARFRRLAPRLPLLFMHDSPEVIAGAVKAGVNGYVTKDVGPEKLRMAIRQIANGGSWFDQTMMNSILSRKKELPQISLREQDVLKLIGRGYRNKQIARELFISEKTVSTHKANLLQKLKLDTTADLIRFADDHQFELGLNDRGADASAGL